MQPVAEQPGTKTLGELPQLSTTPAEQLAVGVGTVDVPEIASSTERVPGTAPTDSGYDESAARARGPNSDALDAQLQKDVTAIRRAFERQQRLDAQWIKQDDAIMARRAAESGAAGMRSGPTIERARAQGIYSGDATMAVGGGSPGAEFRPWDGVTRQSPIETYLSRARGGMDAVYADSFHFQTALSVQDASAQEFGGLIVGAGLRAAKSAVNVFGNAISESISTTLSPYTMAVRGVEVLGESSGVSDVVALARMRQYSMLQENVGYNVSPLAWDQYPTIGRSGTFISDRQGVMGYFGDLRGASEVTVPPSLVTQMETDMGLVPGALQDGFKVRQVTGIRSLTPASPMEGNQYFLGPGNHLPGGGPEVVIRSIPTVDSETVRTLLKVKVGP